MVAGGPAWVADRTQAHNACGALRTILRGFLIRGISGIRKFRPRVYDVLVAREGGS